MCKVKLQNNSLLQRCQATMSFSPQVLQIFFTQSETTHFLPASYRKLVICSYSCNTMTSPIIVYVEVQNNEIIVLDTHSTIPNYLHSSNCSVSFCIVTCAAKLFHANGFALWFLRSCGLVKFMVMVHDWKITHYACHRCIIYQLSTEMYK